MAINSFSKIRWIEYREANQIINSISGVYV